MGKKKKNRRNILPSGFLELPLVGQVLMFKQHLKGDDPDYSSDRREEYEVTSVGEANLITSLVEGGDSVRGYHGRKHKPVIDLDVPATLVPSTTPGHSHLYIDVEMSWPKYINLLWALVDAGIVERGYANASSKKGFSAVRLPWIRKGPFEESQ